MISKQNIQTAFHRTAWVAVGAIALCLSSCNAPSTTSDAESPGSEVAATFRRGITGSHDLLAHHPNLQPAVVGRSR